MPPLALVYMNSAICILAASIRASRGKIFSARVNNFFKGLGKVHFVGHFLNSGIWCVCVCVCVYVIVRKILHTVV
jgi:hypothetical protein